MLRITALLVICELCLAIRVPVVWDGDSAVNHEQQVPQESARPVIPNEYFVYTAEKPKFAADIAAFHGVRNPEQHYKAYALQPYTGVKKPELGKHKLHDEDSVVFQPYQQYTKNEALKNEAPPAAVNYEVYHPYKAEEPALQQLYKDPVLEKIRDDIRNSQHRLQDYEKEAGKPDITSDEYLESPEHTDNKKYPQRNVPEPYEIHRPQRRPIYYRPPPINYQREHILNNKFRHPWNQHNAKIRPVHYRPLKQHIGRLRQHHALKYDDERNEYPQVPPPHQYAEPVDGYDIYEKGREKYVQLKNNVDESINNAVKKNRPTTYQKLEIQDDGGRIESQIGDDEEEFVPIKNYAQVRKTETTKHLPRDAAFADADNLDEIKNAPRLRETVKSTKAQTVYSEEGYEDAAYDHAGEQKHASENEDHAGYLKEKEISAGKYKIPTVSAAYEDAGGSAYRDQSLHGEKWNNDDKEKEEETEAEDYSEDEQENSIEGDIYENVNGERNKRENDEENASEVEDETNDEPEIVTDNDTDDNTNNDIENKTLADNDDDQLNETSTQHEVNKRETKYKVPEINLNTTYLTLEEIANIGKLKIAPKKDDIKEKYPYYFENINKLHKDSPLRYSENLKLIPKKSKGGTEFYDSKSIFECPEVDENVDAIPDKLKKNGHPDSDDDEDEDPEKKKGQANFNHLKENQRLKGLGDKIDCFKAKYFGENPLDSPFFKEGLISNPEPVTAPNLPTYKLNLKEPFTEESKFNNTLLKSEKLKEDTKTDVFVLIDRLQNGQKELQESLVKTNDQLKSSLIFPINFSSINDAQLSHQSSVYADLLTNIKETLPHPLLFNNTNFSSKLLMPSAFNSTAADSNVTYNHYHKKENVTKLPKIVRKKRGAPFVYEPYKIIRDAQVQESKKTTTTSNISPLIKQLQLSRVKAQYDKDQPVKRNLAARSYKDIGKKDREKGDKNSNEDTFVNVNEDPRRGEPRYEHRPANHKLEYTPVENKKSVTLEDYEAYTNKTEKKTEGNATPDKKESKTPRQERSGAISKKTVSTTSPRPYFNIAAFLPQSREAEIEKTSASNTVRKVAKATTRTPEIDVKTGPGKFPNVNENIDEDEDYAEYDDEEESPTTTTTTTVKPSFRRRGTRPTTTTIKPREEEAELEVPKLRLITRFRNSMPSEKFEKKDERTEKPKRKNLKEDHDEDSPKYREKKKKSSKSTLVTDTKTYGDGEDDMRKDEVDALIGVKHDMDDYVPNYEKEAKLKSKHQADASSDSEEDDEEYDEDDDEDLDEDEEDDEEDEEEEDDEQEPEPVITTPEPTKRTLIRTTEAPPSTTEARRSKSEVKPIVVKKKIEIHKELPINKSSPHITQFKQDIKEVEIIKEMPAKAHKKKPNKNFEVLELYKDDNLAKDVNKLGGVEVFKEELDIIRGPRHGGNYRSAKIIELEEGVSSTPKTLHGGNLKIAKEDTETSQSKSTKLVEHGEQLPSRRRGSNFKAPRYSSRSSKLELDEEAEEVTTIRNRRRNQDKNKRREESRTAKVIEFDDERDGDDDSERMHGGNFKTYGSSRNGGRMHGGNYRSAKIVQADDSEKGESSLKQKGEKTKEETANVRGNAAVLLNSFANAVPILTTTPAYILDPSKRMYYYVDA